MASSLEFALEMEEMAWRMVAFLHLTDPVKVMSSRTAAFVEMRPAKENVILF